MKRLVFLAALVAAVVVIAVGARLVHMHEVYGELRLTATETPHRIAVLGRDYDRSESRPTRSTTPPGFVEDGQTESGGTLLVPNGLAGRVPTVLYVRDGDGRLWSYALVGGP